VAFSDGRDVALANRRSARPARLTATLFLEVARVCSFILGLLVRVMARRRDVTGAHPSSNVPP
jgi:hypothetical protein